MAKHRSPETADGQEYWRSEMIGSAQFYGSENCQDVMPEQEQPALFPDPISSIQDI
jgi:hypothetical protein